MGVKGLVIGCAFLALGFLLLTSPYWLLRELIRLGDEPLPDWMGGARARKRRLAVIAGLLAVVGGAVAAASGLLEP